MKRTYNDRKNTKNTHDFERDAIKTVIVCCNYANGLKTRPNYSIGHEKRCTIFFLLFSR